jgi:hypothetical protein
MIQRMEARRLSSIKEWSLISSTLQPALGELSVTRLKSKIGRADKLRQKYWDLYRRQKNWSKSPMTRTLYGGSSAQNLRKKKMFEEAIARLRLQLRKIAEPPQMSTSPSTRRANHKSVKPRTRVTRSKVAQQRSKRRTQSLRSRTASPALAKSASRRAGGYKRRHAHTASSTRRRQSKRDSRG